MDDWSKQEEKIIKETEEPERCKKDGWYGKVVGGKRDGTVDYAQISWNGRSLWQLVWWWNGGCGYGWYGWHWKLRPLQPSQV